MKIINAGYEIITPLNGETILKRIEEIARTCYKSEDKIAAGSAERMVRALIKNGHEAMLEHCSFTVKFIVDRGISHEIVRHRVASFAQESTRYCNYSKEGFGSEITVIRPCFWNDNSEDSEFKMFIWENAMKEAEKNYFKLLEFGATPQEARSVLPNSLKTEICMTANLREWRHFFKLRAADATGKAHPQIKEVTIPLLKELQEKIPVIFEDIESEENSVYRK